MKNKRSYLNFFPNLLQTSHHWILFHNYLFYHFTKPKIRISRPPFSPPLLFFFFFFSSPSSKPRTIKRYYIFTTFINNKFTILLCYLTILVGGGEGKIAYHPKKRSSTIGGNHSRIRDGERDNIESFFLIFYKKEKERKKEKKRKKKEEKKKKGFISEGRDHYQLSYLLLGNGQCDQRKKKNKTKKPKNLSCRRHHNRMF